jgi:hypothetical protein
VVPLQSLYRSAEGRYAALSESLEGATAEGEKLAQVSTYICVSLQGSRCDGVLYVPRPITKPAPCNYCEASGTTVTGIL